MTRARFMLLLVAALAAICGAFYLSSQRNLQRDSRGAPLFPTLAPELNTVTEVSILKGSATPAVTLHKSGEQWTVAERADYPANVAKLGRLLRALADAKVVEEKTSDPANYPIIGVEDPAKAGATGAEISVLAQDGRHSLIVGKPVGEGTFARRPGDSKSYAVEPAISVEPEPRSWIDTRLLVVVDPERRVQTAIRRRIHAAPDQAQRGRLRVGQDARGTLGAGRQGTGTVGRRVERPERRGCRRRQRHRLQPSRAGDFHIGRWRRGEPGGRPRRRQALDRGAVLEGLGALSKSQGSGLSDRELPVRRHFPPAGSAPGPERDQTSRRSWRIQERRRAAGQIGPPAHGTVISGTSAGFGRRFAALIYDSLLLAALLLVYTGIVVAIRGGAITAAAGGPWWFLYRGGELAIVAAYYVINWLMSGATLGMRAWHLRVVSETGKRLKLLRALWRCVCGFFAWSPAALGVLWLYADPEHLALHDRLSGTRVVHLTGS